MPLFDQGYQHWTGPLSGHAWRWLAITRHGVRVGLKSRVVRLVLFVSWLPAVALAVVLCLWGLLERKSDLVTPYLQFFVFLGRPVVADPRHYRVEIWTICYDYFLLTELRFSMLLVLLVGPNLVSQDLRFNALPLYLSRPLRRIDYFAGKLGVIVTFLGLVVILPSVIAYALGLLFSLDLTIIRDTYRILLASLAYGVIVAVSAGLLVLALSSLTRNSRYVALFWLGLWFVGGVTGTVLQKVDHEQRQHAINRTMPPLPNFPRNNGERSQVQQLMAERAWQRSWQRHREEVQARLQAEEIRAAPSDWRPLVSYTANLSRIGQQLLGTDARWVALGQLQPPDERRRFLYNVRGPQYPWYWSAAVLAGLLGLSACILNLNVKSLDRLK